ncbi:MAG: helix-turn-helix transcriptional regulator [Bacteroidetes bacterium]|nr:helix-turn-helix transcriptional regulator [Bacteroidota bacterium]
MAKEKDILVRIGDILQKKARQKYKSNVELANIANVSEGTIRRIFNGNQNTSVKLLKSVCSALDIKLSDLFKEVGA